MKKLNLLKTSVLGLFLFFGLTQAKAADITFEVDMTGFTPSPNGVHVAGSFGVIGVDDWDATAWVCEQDGTSNIYKVTIPVKDNSSFKFKFMNGDAWGTEETVPAAIGTGADRCVQIGTSEKTIRFAYNGMPLAGFSLVTFKVDMSAESVSGGKVRITGGLNGWDPDVTELTKEGSTAIYSRNLYVITDALVDYKYINGTVSGWAGIEYLNGLPCANTSNNRSLTPLAATETVTNKFNSCAVITTLVETTSTEITIYPNPASDNLNISGLTGSTSVQIINGIGNIVKHVTLAEGNSSINISDLNSGLYLVQIKNNNALVVKKITKK